MKRALIGAAVAAAALLALPVTAQMMGYGMGPGMMGGYDEGYGMGPGMMGYGPGAYASNLKLTQEQRDKIAEIQTELAQKRWGLMTSMHQQRLDMFKSGAADEAALRKSFQAMQETQKQMFEARLDANKRMAAVLTPEQRKQLPSGSSRFGMMW